jgi:hypothetical protein
MKAKELLEWDYKGDSGEDTTHTFDVTVYVDSDVDFLDMSSLYDGDNEEIKQKMRLRSLNQQMKDPHWLDEDDLHAVESALTELNAEVDFAGLTPTDTWPQLEFYVIVDLDGEVHKPSSVSGWFGRKKVQQWAIAIEAKIMETLRARGKDVGDLNCNFGSVYK